MIEEGMKRCKGDCGRVLPLSEFHKVGKRTLKSGIVRQHRRSVCKVCTSKQRKVRLANDADYREKVRAQTRESRYRTTSARPANENKECSCYLGFLAEKVLANSFEKVEVMDNNNPGFDFICGKGFKVDAKSSCMHVRYDNKCYWNFMIRRNKVADYFLCVAFDNRKDKNPIHVWLIPGKEINHLMTLKIYLSKKSLKRVVKFEQPLDDVLDTCSTMREADIID